MKIFRRLRRFLFGNDIFISYSRKDGYEYALQLTSRLGGFSIFIDQLGSTPGKEIPQKLRKKLINSTVLVIVGTEAAAASNAVQEEVEVFVKTVRPIIPISFNGSLELANYFENSIFGLAIADEDVSALTAGNPSESVLNRIDQSFRYTRRRTGLRYLFIGTFTFLILSITGVLSFSYFTIDEANKQKDTAEKIRDTALEEKRAADKEVQKSVKRINELNRQYAEVSNDLEISKDNLSRNIKLLRNTEVELQREQGNLATYLTNLRGREKDALSMGINAVGNNNSDEVESSAHLGLANSWYNYLSFTPFPIRDIALLKYVTDTPYSIAITIDNEAMLVDTQSMEIAKSYSLSDSSTPISDIKISLDGTFITFLRKGNYAQNRDVLVMLDALTGEQKRSLELEETKEYTISKQGNLVLVMLDDFSENLPQLWNFSGLTLIAELNSPSISNAQFSEYENKLVSIDRNSRPKVWNAADGALITEIQTDSLDITTFRMSRSGDIVFTGHGHSNAYVWRSETGKLIQELSGGHSEEKYFYTPTSFNDGDQPEESYRNPGGRFLLQDNMGINDIDFTEHAREGYRMVTAANDKTAGLWNINGDLVRSLVGHGDQVTKALFSEDGHFLATADSKGTILVHDTSKGRPLDSFRGLKSNIKEMSFLKDNRLQILTEDGVAYLWTIFGDVDNLTFEHTGETIASALFHPDGERIITTDWNGNIRIWDREIGKLLQSKQYLPEGIGTTQTPEEIPGWETDGYWNTQHSLQDRFPPDPYKIWDLDHVGNPKEPGKGDRPGYREMLTAKLSPNGKMVLCQTSEGVGIVYRLHRDSIEQVTSFKNDLLIIKDGEFLSDGKSVFTYGLYSDMSYTNSIHTGELLDTQYGSGNGEKTANEEHQRLLEKINKTNPALVTGNSSIKVFPNKKYFLTYSFSRSFQLFRYSDGSLLSSKRIHLGRVYDLNISPDGKYFISIGEDKKAKLFAVPSLEYLRRGANSVLKQ